MVKAKAKPAPPSDYVCAACNERGHWVYDCTQRVRKLKKKQLRKEEIDAGAKKRVRDQLEADEPRDDGGGGGGRRKKEVKISFDEPVVKNPKQREPTAADIAKANAMMPVIKLSQAPRCHCGEKARARKNRDPQSPWHGLMVWWCAKDKSDESNCRYARRMEAPGEQ